MIDWHAPFFIYSAFFWKNYFRHAVDILLVAYIFYKLILLIRGTRSVQIIQGLLLLMVATFIVVDIFGLPMTAAVLKRFWSAGIIIIAVVFQPEIRSILAQLGSQPLSRWILPSSFQFIEEILTALKECAEKKIGALIVLEQETGLKNFVETGTKVNAEISSELIVSMLHPRAPLHDGAIIISGSLCVAAGCVLPITDDPHFAKVLGMRHRAAVGLSEISDALILVVSEETGALSIAREGRLERSVDFDQIKKQLYDLYYSKAKKTLLRRSSEIRNQTS